MAATITVRRLVNGDSSYGSGAGDFLSDRDAVAQIILTRLKLLQGEWWEDLTQGLPLFQSMLGQSGSDRHTQVVMLLLQQNILAAPYVTAVTDINASFNGGTRQFGFSCTVQTQFGTIPLSTNPGTSASLGN